MDMLLTLVAHLGSPDPKLLIIRKVSNKEQRKCVCVRVYELHSSTHVQTTWLHQCRAMQAFRISVCTGIMCENPFIYTF